MNIVGQTKQFVATRILSVVKPKQRRLFSFGLQALSLTPYYNLGSNARQIVKNICTASSKIYRLVSSKTLIQNFHPQKQDYLLPIHQAGTGIVLGKRWKETFGSGVKQREEQFIPKRKQAKAIPQK